MTALAASLFVMTAAATRDSVNRSSMRPRVVLVQSQREKERRDDEPFGGMCGDERQLVYAAGLTESIHASGPLLEPRRIPRQLVVHHHAALVMEIEAFRRSVGREQRPAALVERVLDAAAVGWRHAAMQNCGWMPGGGKALLEPRERIAVLGEDYRRLADPREEPQQERDLALVARGDSGCLGDGREPAAFPLRVCKTRRAKRRRWRIVLEGVFVLQPGERQIQLPGFFRAVVAQQGQPALDRGGERARARERALAQQNRHQPCAVVAAPAGFLPYPPAVAIEQVVHPALGPGRNDCQHGRLPRLAFADVRSRPLEQHDRFVAPDATERIELRRAASVRCRGEKHHMAGPDGDRVHRRAAIGPDCGGVRLVDDDDIPRHVFERAQDFGSLHEVVRGDVDPGKRPRVHVRRPFCGHQSQPRGVGQERGQREARGELREPLLPEAGRCEHERATGLVAMRELHQQQTGLNRLAETHSVCDEQPGDAVPEHSERRLELIGQEANRRLRGGAEGSERMQPKDRAVELVEPAPTADDAGARIAVNRSRAIERCQQRLRAVATESRAAARPCNRLSARREATVHRRPRTMTRLPIVSEEAGADAESMPVEWQIGCLPCA